MTVKSLLQIGGIVLLMVVNGFSLDRPEQPQTMLLTGVVYDQNGAVIITSRVVAYGPDAKEYETSTNSEGIYELQLPLGTYEMEASAVHFCPTLVKGFAVVNSTYRKMSQDFVLVVRDSKCKDERPKKRKQVRPDRKQAPIEIVE